jgi:hypothetical protein
MKVPHKLVILTTVLNQLIGFLWYSPMLFLGAWAAAQGKSLSQMTMSDPLPFVWDIAHAIALSYATAWVIARSEASCPVTGAKVGALLALAFTVPALGAHYGFLGLPGTVLLVDAGKELVAGALIGAVFGFAKMRMLSPSRAAA